MPGLGFHDHHRGSRPLIHFWTGATGIAAQLAVDGRLPVITFDRQEPEALEAVKDVFPTWRGQNEQSMALAAIAFAKAKRRRAKKVWLRKNPARARENARRYYKKVQAEMIAAYGGCCSCCGEREPRFLTLEHMNRDGAEHLFHEPLHGPVRTERGTEKVGDGVVGGHKGITRFVRLCHSARSSRSPLSGSNRISPLRAKPAAMGSA